MQTKAGEFFLARLAHFVGSPKALLPPGVEFQLNVCSVLSSQSANSERRIVRLLLRSRAKARTRPPLPSPTGHGFIDGTRSFLNKFLGTHWPGELALIFFA